MGILHRIADRPFSGVRIAETTNYSLGKKEIIKLIVNSQLCVYF